MNEEKCCDSCGNTKCEIIFPLKWSHSKDYCSRWQPKPISEVERIAKDLSCPPYIIRQNGLHIDLDKIAQYVFANYRPKSKSVDSEELMKAIEGMTYNHYPRENFIYNKDIKEYIKQQTEVR